MKNPFPKIGKVIKYEYKHSSKRLFPLYGVLLALGLFTGLSVNPKKYENMLDQFVETQSFSYQSQGAEAARSMITGMLIFAVVVLTVAVSVVTIVTLARRFDQSMLGDEAYLNLSLPVTMGQHIMGRYIMDILWMFCCAIVIFGTFLLCFIRMDLSGMFNQFIDYIPEINQQLSQHNFTIEKLICYSLIISLGFCSLIISLIFVVNAISHLLKNNKNLFKFIAVILLIWLWGKSMNFGPSMKNPQNTAETGLFLLKATCYVTGINVAWSAIYLAFTHFVFTKQLNLE